MLSALLAGTLGSGLPIAGVLRAVTGALESELRAVPVVWALGPTGPALLSSLFAFGTGLEGLSLLALQAGRATSGPINP